MKPGAGKLAGEKRVTGTEKITSLLNMGNKDEIEEGEEEKEDNAKRTKTVMSNYVKNIKKVGVYYSDL